MRPQAPYIAEKELLLALLCSPSHSGDGMEWLSLLEKVNWRNFLAITCQDLYPYLAFRLEPHVACLGASREWEPLSAARRLTAIHNLRLRHELGKAIEALRMGGIPALALKGAVLAYTAYPDPSLRPMTDLDLLVPPGKREKAVGVLRTLGYEYPQGTVPHLQWRLLPGQESVNPLRLGASMVLLEVHSQLECSQPVLPTPTREFWSRSRSIDLRGLRVRTLCPEDFLFHLCLHQSRHHRFEKGLLPLVDLRMLLDAHPDWNWAGIATRSLRSECAAWMYVTLEAARNLVGAPVPDVFFQALPKPHDLPELRCLVEEQIWSAQSRTPALPTLLSMLLAEPSWQCRARMFFNRMWLVQWEEVGPGPSFICFIRVVQLCCRRLVATIKAKVPRYLRARRSGQLKLDTIQRTVRLLHHSNTLFRLVEQQAGCEKRLESK